MSQTWNGQQLPELPDPPCPFSVPMTHERLKWCLAVIGWSRSELAFRLNISNSTAAQYSQGRRNIPNRLAVWIESLAAMHQAMPQPFGWGLFGDGLDEGFELARPSPANPWAGEAAE